MKIYTEKSLHNFEFWSGAKTTAETIWDKFGQEGFDTIESNLEMDYPDGMDETQINDLFWFEEDYIATLLGYRNWEHLERGNDLIKIKCTNIEWDIDEDEETPDDLPKDVEILIDDKEDIGDFIEDEDYYITQWLKNEYGYDVDGVDFEEV